MGPGAASQKLNADNHNRAGASIKWASALAPCHPVTKQQAGRPMLKTFMVSLPRILRKPQEKTGAELGEIIPSQLVPSEASELSLPTDFSGALKASECFHQPVLFGSQDIQWIKSLHVLKLN